MSGISGLASFDLAAEMRLPSATKPALAKGAKAAREFEAQLIGTLLESLEKTLAALPGEDAMSGQDDYNYLGTQALASAIAAGGGFGIARLISRTFAGTKGVAGDSFPEEGKSH